MTEFADVFDPSGDPQKAMVGMMQVRKNIWLCVQKMSSGDIVCYLHVYWSFEILLVKWHVCLIFTLIMDLHNMFHQHTYTKIMPYYFRLKYPNFVSEEWSHVLTWDLFVGRWIWLDGLRRGVFTCHSVLLCNLIGPPGLLLHWATCILTGKGLPGNEATSIEEMEDWEEDGRTNSLRKRSWW